VYILRFVVSILMKDRDWDNRFESNLWHHESSNHIENSVGQRIQVHDLTTTKN
jgi:outer membrane protease